MIKRMLIDTPIRYPRAVIVLGVLLTMAFLAAFPGLKTDTDPVRMLPADNPAVTLYNGIKKDFRLNDIVALGIRSRDGSSLFTPDGLARIDAITKEILEIRDEEMGTGEMGGGVGDNELFVAGDVMSVSTVDDITRNEQGELMVLPLMETPPTTTDEAKRILERLNQNPMLAGKMAATDGSLAGIFIPMKEGKKERAFYLGERVKAIAARHLGKNEAFYFAGLPIAESTFGNEMFVQMSMYAPMAGVVIFLLMFYFFRSLKLVAAPMLLGVMVVIWSMGALIYSGNVIHIMSSMIPIFLLPIAVLNSVHILSKLGDRIADYPSRAEAVRSVMKELFNPMLYTSITTVVGFVSLAATGIPPVMVFGVTVGFGVLMSWLMSMLFIPAYTMLLSDKALAGFAGKKRKSPVIEVVRFFGTFSARKAGTVLAAAGVLLVVAYIGLTMIVVNDNPVRWFKKGHSIREADVAMNQKLAGTYMANLHFSLTPATADPKPAASDGFVDDFADNFADEFSAEETTAPSLRDPRVIAYIDGVGHFLRNLKKSDGTPAVGGVTSIADVLRKVGKEALGDSSLPDSREKVSQYIFLFETGDLKKGKDLRKLLTPDSRASQMWVFFKSGDNQLMTYVMNQLDRYMAQNPPPVPGGVDGAAPVKVRWSGLMHINNVWQKEMVEGMLKALQGSFVIVFLMMIFLFRGIRWAVIAMLPLSLTILFIYGAIGLSGKFYDMPIAVLSSLTLGLSVDFAIHFIEHARVLNRTIKNKSETLRNMFAGTAQAIWRNVLVISIGFCPLFFAGLVPYMTVGSFFFAIMLMSGSVTLMLVPAVVTRFGSYLPGFREQKMNK